MILQTIQWLTVFMTMEWSAEGLIGLRPPSATYKPHPTQIKHHYPVRRGTTPNPRMFRENDDIKLFLLHRSQLGRPVTKEIWDRFLESRVSGPEDLSGTVQAPTHVTAKNCRPSIALRCSIRFLKSYLRNNTAYCESVQELEKCMEARLEGCDSEESSKAHQILDILKLKSPSGHSCDKSINPPSYVVTQVLSYSPCCVVNLLQCTEYALRDLQNNVRSCDSLSNYTSCAAFSFRDYSNNSAEKIFRFILTLTKTCIHTRKPFL